MMKKAFTLIELIMVIVILAILSLIGTNIYTNVYTNYLSSAITDEVESKAQIALDQIALRLSDRVKQATIGRKSSNFKDFVLVYDRRLSRDHDILEWIGQSTQSRNLPGSTSIADTIGWSGFLDLGRYKNKNEIFIGGNLKLAKSVINSVSDGGDKNLAMIFQGVDYLNADGYGFADKEDKEDKEEIKKVLIFDLGDNGVAQNVRYGGEKISDNYQIAHSAYAIVPEKKPSNPDIYNLYLYYDYRPWIGQSYKNGKKALLVENVTLFRFRGFSASGMDLKLCLNADAEKYGITDNKFIVCKTKVVF